MNVLWEVRKRHRQRLKLGRSRYRLKKPKRILYPRLIEKDYQQQLVHYIGTFYSVLVNRVTPVALEAIQKAQQTLPANLRHDADDTSSDDINRAFDEAAQDWKDVANDVTKQNMAQNYGEQISGFNRKQVQRSIEGLVGFPIYFQEPYLKEAMTNFAHTNAELITKMEDTMKSDIQGIVFRGLQEGKRWEDMVPDIKERGEVGKSRARLIARDQTNKFNGQLNKYRQTEVGLKKYYWRGVMDERERDEHVDREGQLREWGDGDIEPGQEPQCRCWAEPVIEVEDLNQEDEAA